MAPFVMMILEKKEMWHFKEVCTTLEGWGYRWGPEHG